MFTKMQSYVTIFLLSAFVLFGSSCKKNRTLNALQGDWEVTSYTEDGEELINSFISSFTMEYEEYGESAGDFQWTFIEVGGGTTVINGEYICNDDATELDLEFDGGGDVEFDFEVDGDELTMEGNVDGFFYVIRADRD